MVVRRGMCIRGFPFLVGFYSKDYILGGGGLLNFFLFLVFLMGCFFTVSYSLRIIRDISAGGLLGVGVFYGGYVMFIYVSFFVL